ncbi:MULTISPECIES: hypothetical protein [Vibrio]|uniref:hypothetical protein n=1 Tax=Vibrio TaxID=662 RepID=UPI00015650FB|nr:MULTISPECIES: hypothetical protein [Vibrio harveyi group]ELB7645965.1 hypothetical protein [Vibrio vulnificus]EDM57646.1 hypothetical protein A79_2067 [Vibrio parahaemolyticus AQ3810]EHK4786525.1 hypothetical protein [Vibrio parahaemolyticus]EIJ0976101.1 hypothetical protein [Vibrio parahaemolyticus]EJG1927593.1 hypothetical protein [Vibrio parahaemolyticus]
MQRFEDVINVWKENLVQKIELGSLLSKSPVAHKWKCTHRSLVLRELTFWRITDLIEQAYLLHKNEHALGVRILLRSAIETSAVLIYLNQRMVAVMSGKLAFSEFSDISSQLLLGSKNEVTNLSAINVMTVLKHCERKYTGISKIYSDLCESAHPNYEGICAGYSIIDHEKCITQFGNFWHEACCSQHDNLFYFIMKLYESEYNEFPKVFESFEQWIVNNDKKLETAKAST